MDPEVEWEGEKQDLTIRMFNSEEFQLSENEEALLTLHILAVKASQVQESSWSKETLEQSLLDESWWNIRNALKTEQDYLGLQHYGIKEEMVIYEGCIYILDSNALKLKVVHQCNNLIVAEHFVRDNTLYLTVTGALLTL